MTCPTRETCHSGLKDKDRLHINMKIKRSLILRPEGTTASTNYNATKIIIKKKHNTNKRQLWVEFDGLSGWYLHLSKLVNFPNDGPSLGRIPYAHTKRRHRLFPPSTLQHTFSLMMPTLYIPGTAFFPRLVGSFLRLCSFDLSPGNNDQNWYRVTRVTK